MFHTTKNSMYWQPRRFLPALWPIATGLLWFVFGWRSNIAIAVLTTLPGVVLTAAGGAQLLWGGDRQIPAHMALTGLLGIVLALVLSPALGWLGTPLLVIGNLGTFLIAGLAAFYQHPQPVELPASRLRIGLLRKLATDNALLGFFVNCATIPRGAAADADIQEIADLKAVMTSRGWYESPENAHPEPESPTDATLKPARAMRKSFEWLRFDSGYQPDHEVPGARRWAGYTRNQRMAARVLRHTDSSRPWLVCIHGYRMGSALLDFGLFNADYLHRTLGLNILMPILPLHGPRRTTRLSGGRFLDGPMADLLHAERQAVWDLRRCLAWIRQDAPDVPIGVLGYSLGGYNAALLAALDPELACVIAGIPLVDMPEALWHHMPSAHRQYLEYAGLSRVAASAALSPISPLALAPRVPHARRFIIGGTMDQIVPPQHPLSLWAHWDEPAVHWYRGSHLSVREEPGTQPFIDEALRSAKLI